MTSNLSHVSIRDYAQRILATYPDVVEESGFVDVDGLAKSLGAEIRIENSDVSATVHGQNDFSINVPSFTSRRQDRFTVARAIADYFLHYRYPDRTGKVDFQRGLNDRDAVCSNVFAASLLMPDEEFAEAWEAGGGDIWAMSRIFGVSPKAAEVRASVLGLSNTERHSAAA